ncbi:hypothetical protein WA026_010511 [Henosepilachna vigintioctopunctata]|uniref:Uncharacterized protein n=1 Tax=Henosepilachna vigintioctopunctata TaxID=420089 RepID=A0AAW1VCE3_9CUCU
MEGSNMKTLLYGNVNSRTRNETPLKKSVRSSSGSINGTDKETPTSRSDNRSVSKTSKHSEDNLTVTMSNNSRPQRSSSTEGSAMKSLLYGTPSPPASIATKKAPLKKSLRGSADNSKVNKGPMKAIHSIKSHGSDMNIRIYGDAQIPSGEGQYQDGSAESVDYSISRRPSLSRRSRSVGPLSVSEIQEENQEILRTNRYKGIGGSNMKNILYGGNTYGDETGKSDYNYNDWSNTSENVNVNTSEIQENNQEILRANRFKGIGGSNMKNILYGITANSYESDSNYECTTRCDNPFMENSPRGNEEQCPYIDPLPEKKVSSRKGYESKSETPRYETKPVIRHSAFEGDTMKNLLYGEHAPVTSTEPAYQSDDNYQEISDGEAAIEIQGKDEYPSCTSLHQDAADEENITLEFFSVESPEEPVGVLIPYDVINQFAPECGDNIERTAVALKHGHLVDCTCRMKMRNQQEKPPCVRHILPKDLQFYNEASKVLEIISSPFGEENDRKISAIENNLARKYPNYYNNFVQKFNRQLSEDYRTKEQQSKLGVITSYQKLLAEENLFSKRAKCPINKKENISGKMKNLEKDFHTACKTLKKDYPFLFVQLLQEYDFPSLALEKNVVEKNRMSLLDISQLGTQKLQEFEEMFTNQQFHE